MSMKSIILSGYLILIVTMYIFCGGPEPVSVHINGMPDGNFLELMEGQEQEVIETLTDAYCGMPEAHGCYPEFEGNLSYEQTSGSDIFTGFNGRIKNDYYGNPLEADMEITLDRWAGSRYNGTFSGVLNWERVSATIDYNGNSSTRAIIDEFNGQTSVNRGGALYIYDFNYRITTTTDTYTPVYWYEGTVTFNNISYTLPEEIHDL